MKFIKLPAVWYTESRFTCDTAVCPKIKQVITTAVAKT